MRAASTLLPPRILDPWNEVQTLLTPFSLTGACNARVMQFWAIPLSPLQVVIAQLCIEETYDALVQQVPSHEIRWVYQNLLAYIVRS